MSFLASCATSEPSTNSTKEWTSDCGWIDDVDPLPGQAEEEVRLDDLEPLVHHRRRVDRDLRPHLPGRVRQRVLDRDRVEVSRRRSRNGPPEAVSTSRATSSARPHAHAPGGSRCARSRPARSRRRSRRPPRGSARPATTSGSLLASASRLPGADRGVAPSAGPSAPTRPPTTVSASDAWRPRRGPPRPQTIRQRDARRQEPLAAATVLGRARPPRARGRNRATCSASFSIERPAASATTRKRSGKAATTSSAEQPIEPVEPRMERDLHGERVIILAGAARGQRRARAGRRSRQDRARRTAASRSGRRSRRGPAGRCPSP